MRFYVLIFVNLLCIESSAFAGVSVNGNAQGYTVETNNTIIVDGLRVNQNHANEAAVKIDNPHGKRIIVKDVRITTKNGNYQSSQGASAAMVIDAGDGSLEVDHVSIDAHGDTHSRAEGSGNVCAALYCSQRSAKKSRESSERTKVTVHGGFSATANKKKN